MPVSTRTSSPTSFDNGILNLVFRRGCAALPAEPALDRGAARSAEVLPGRRRRRHDRKPRVGRCRWHRVARRHARGRAPCFHRRGSGPENELTLAGSIVRRLDDVEDGRRRHRLAIHGQKRVARLRHASQRRPRRDCVDGTGALFKNILTNKNGISRSEKRFKQNLVCENFDRRYGASRSSLGYACVAEPEQRSALWHTRCSSPSWTTTTRPPRRTDRRASRTRKSTSNASASAAAAAP